MRHENNVQGIAFMEALLRPMTWEDFPSDFKLQLQSIDPNKKFSLIRCELSVNSEKDSTNKFLLDNANIVLHNKANRI
jgi:hypothetical protein